MLASVTTNQHDFPLKVALTNATTSPAMGIVKILPLHGRERRQRDRRREQ